MNPDILFQMFAQQGMGGGEAEVEEGPLGASISAKPELLPIFHYGVKLTPNHQHFLSPKEKDHILPSH